VRPAPSAQAGFTLLELMVVAVIVGILATMFTLSIGVTGGDRDLEREADRLRALVELAAEDALLQGRELGLQFYEGGYEFVTLDPVENRWQGLSGDALLRARRLPEGIEMALELDGRSVRLRDAEDAGPRPGDDDGEDGTDWSPQVYIFSSGDVSPPFTLRLRRRFANDGLQISVEPDGAVDVRRDAA